MARPAEPRFFLMTDTDRLPDPVGAVRHLPRNAAVIFRHYDASERDRLAETLARTCRPYGVSLSIAGDVTLASRVNAAGLHLPEGLMRHGLRHRTLAWRQSKPGRFLSAAVHDSAALAAARRLGVDFVLLSPIFPTASHPGALSLGVVRLTAWTRQYGAGLKIIALGGVNGRTARRLAGTGVTGCAGIDGIVTLSRAGRRYRF